MLQEYVDAVRAAPATPPSEGMAAALLVHGDCLMGLGRFDEAEQSLLEAKRAFEQALGPDHPAVARTARMLFELDAKRGESQGDGP